MYCMYNLTEHIWDEPNADYTPGLLVPQRLLHLLHLVNRVIAYCSLKTGIRTRFIFISHSDISNDKHSTLVYENGLEST